jgi:hypothetical protein
LRFLRDFVPEAPDDLGIMLVAHRAPPLPFLPPERYGTPALGLLLTWSGAISEGTRVIAPLLHLGSPLGNLVRPVPYPLFRVCSMGPQHPATAPIGAPCACRSCPMRRSSCHVAGRPRSHVAVFLDWLGDRRCRQPGCPGGHRYRRTRGRLRASAHRHLVARRSDAAQHVAWVATAGSDCGPTATVVSIQPFWGTRALGVRSAYRDGWARLVALKNTYDPTERLPTQRQYPAEST